MLKSRPYKVLPYVCSIVIDGDNTSANVKVSFVRTSDLKIASSYIVTPIPGANRYCFPMTPIDTANHKIELALTNNKGVRQLAVGTAQMEATYLQRGACNDYVSRGVSGDAYPYHGAGVDGVEYFETITEWGYVSDNYGLVTQQTPTQIDSGTLHGVLLEPAVINKVLYNNTFSNAAWTKAGVALTDNTIASPFGPNTLTKLAEDGNAGNHGVAAAYSSTCSAPSSASSSTTFSAVVQPAERTRAYLEINSGAAIVGYAYFDLLTGKVGSFFGQYANADIWAEGSAWRISLTVDAGANFASYPGQAVAKLYAATDDKTIAHQGFPGYGIYAGLTQWEINEMATSHTGDQTTSPNLRRDDYMDIDLPSALPSASDVTVSLGVTPWDYSGTPAKSNWYYIAYGSYDSNNRFGLFFRPGMKGHMKDPRAIGIDYYLNSDQFNGSHLLHTFNHGDGFRTVFTFGPNDLSTDPSFGVSGSGLAIEDHYGDTQVAINRAVPSLNFNAILPQKLCLGRNKPTGAMMHPLSLKEISIRARQLSKDEMIPESKPTTF